MLTVSAQPPAVATSHQRLEPLTALRFIAAAYVLIHHCLPLIAIHAASELAEAIPGGNVGDIIGKSLIGFVASGNISVSFFFVLSGFLLSYTYSRRAPIRRRDFFVSRFARIYPMYLLAFAVSTPIAIADISAHTPNWNAPLPVKVTLTAVASLSLQQSWLPIIAQKWNSPAWSLGVEAFFYLMFPFVVVHRNRPTSSKRLIIQITLLWILIIAIMSCYWVVAPGGLVRTSSPLEIGPNIGHTFWADLVRLCPLLRLPEFLIGATMGRLFLLDHSLGIDRFGRCLSPLLLLVAVVLSFSFWLPPMALSTGAMSPLFAIIIYSISMPGRFEFLGSRPLVFLGEASYGIYILHAPVLIYFNKIVSWLFGPILDPDGVRVRGVLSPSLTFFTIQVAVVTIISSICLCCVERPFRSYILNWWRPNSR